MKLSIVSRSMGAYFQLRRLPAELYPQMWESAFINFCVLRMEVLLHACTALPAELYPHLLYSVVMVEISGIEPLTS